VDIASGAVLEWAGGVESSGSQVAVSREATVVPTYRNLIFSAAAGICIASLIWAVVVLPNVQTGTEISVSAPLPDSDDGDSDVPPQPVVENITTGELAGTLEGSDVLTAADTNAVHVVEIVILPESRPIKDDVRPVTVTLPEHKAEPSALPVVEPAPTVAPTVVVLDPLATDAGVIDAIAAGHSGEVRDLTGPAERRRAELDAARAAAAEELGRDPVQPLDLTGFDRFEKPVDVVASPARVTKKPNVVAPPRAPDGGITIEVEDEKSVPRKKPQRGMGVGDTRPALQPEVRFDNDGNPIRVSVSIDVEDDLEQGMVAALSTADAGLRRAPVRFRATARKPQIQSVPSAGSDSMKGVSAALRGGHLPAPATVHVAEFVSTFDYRYPQPEAGQDLSIVTDLMPSMSNMGDRTLRIGVQPGSLDSKCVVGVAFNPQYVKAYRQIGEAGRHVASADGAVTLLFDLQLADDVPEVARLVEIRARIADGGKAPTYARTVTSRYNAETLSQAGDDAQLAVIAGGLAEAFQDNDTPRVSRLLNELRRLAATAPTNPAVRAMVRLFQ
jgi:hypothetical protein